MPIKTQTPTNEQINELRNMFIEKYEQNPPADPFHPVDIERVRNADTWCRRFLEMYDLDMKQSFEKLWETCIWRQKFGANDLNETNLRPEYLKDGVVFTHNKDIDGKPLLIFKTKLHTKGTKDMDEVIRVVVYWIERIHRETNMSQITVIFDMAGTSLSNMDLDFVKRIIETFKLYYPNALNYILVYEMAWVLSAAFKIIKSLLPPKAPEILKTISKKEINTYIDKNNCLTSWGGNDDYEFTFVPERRGTPTTTPTPTVAQSNGTVPAGSNELTITNSDLHNGQSQDKKVHFEVVSPTKSSQMADCEDRTHTPQDPDMLRIVPNDFITFNRGDGSECIVDLTCISKFPITYKIQTTSPEKFRVRPRCGVLNQGESVSVSIVLKAENQLSEVLKDKFLVMCIPSPGSADLTPQQLTDVWKQKLQNSPDVEQHRLTCVYKGANELSARNGYGHASGDAMERKQSGSLTELSKHAKQLEKQLRFTQILQCVTLVFLLILSVAVVYLLKLQISPLNSAADVGIEADTTDFSCPMPKKL